MKHARKELWFEVPERRAYLNITPQVEEFVRESGIANGLCLVNPMHITAAVYVNDDERGLLADIDDWLERLAPHEPLSQYRHNNGEDNATPTARGSRSSTPSSTADGASASC